MSDGARQCRREAMFSTMGTGIFRPEAITLWNGEQFDIRRDCPVSTKIMSEIKIDLQPEHPMYNDNLNTSCYIWGIAAMYDLTRDTIVYARLDIVLSRDS